MLQFFPHTHTYKSCSRAVHPSIQKLFKDGASVVTRLVLHSIARTLVIFVQKQPLKRCTNLAP